MNARYFDHTLEWGLVAETDQSVPADWRKWPAPIARRVEQAFIRALAQYPEHHIVCDLSTCTPLGNGRFQLLRKMWIAE